MYNNKEYHLCKQVACYLKYQYPDVLYHFDLTGLNLSKAQAGMAKAIQHSKGYPDLFIAEKRNGHAGLFIELKAEGTDLLKKRMVDAYGYPMWASDHIKEQHEMIERLEAKGYRATFGIGWDDIKNIIDSYLKK